MSTFSLGSVPARPRDTLDGAAPGPRAVASEAARAARASIVVCTYTADRLELARASITAALSQSGDPEVIVVVDHNEALLQQLRREFGSRAIVVPNAHARGLSGARNTGIEASHGELVAFVDDDAVAPAGWLAALQHGCEDPDAIAAGGHAVPVWESPRPDWFPDEFLWVVGCSYAGMTRRGPVRNVLGCSMAFRRDVFGGAGLFDASVGRLGRKPLGAEETELCIRARRWRPGSRIVMVDAEPVRHHVSADRTHFGYFAKRCFYEGVSKSVLARLAGGDVLESERGHLLRALPAAFVREIVASVRDRRAAPLLRALAIAAGTVAAGTGFATGMAAAKVPGRRERLAARSEGGAR